MTVFHAFVAAIEEERSTAHAQLLLAATHTDRITAIGRLADLDELLLRALDGVGERAPSRALMGPRRKQVQGAPGGKGKESPGEGENQHGNPQDRAARATT